MVSNVAERGHVPGLPFAFFVKSGLQIVLVPDLLMKKLTVIMRNVDEATEMRMRNVPMFTPLLSVLTVISSDLCPGTKLYQWETPGVSHSHGTNTVRHVLMKKEE